MEEKNNGLISYYEADSKTLIGQRRRRLVDVDSGEEIEVDQIVKRAYGQKAFWKLYLMDFLQILGVLDSKQIDVLIYILENTQPSTNLFIGTWAKVEAGTGISHRTIARVFKKLTEREFLFKIQNGVWQVSPNIVMKGDDRKRKLLIEYYEDSQRPNPTSTKNENHK